LVGSIFVKLFQHKNREASDASRLLYAQYEIAYTVVEFLAAVLFIIGSIMFFYDELQTAGTWMFLIGSLFFAAKPALRVSREIKLYRMGDVADLAQRYRD